MESITSFFDEEKCEKLKKFWTKPPKGIEKIKHIKPILQDQFYKKTKKNNKSKLRQYLIDDNLFYFTKKPTSDKITGSQNICVAKLEFIQNADPKTLGLPTQEPLFGFKLVRNQKKLEIFTQDKAVWTKWKDILYQRCMLTTFHEDFVVTKMIGKGSFAKVYLATKKDKNIQYAIKAFNKQFMTEQHQGKESLINEINVMKSLNHPHLLKLYEVYETTNSVYFVLEILQGGELLNQIRENHSLSENKIRIIMKSLLEGLDYLHDKNIMHRDLKPENVLIRTKDKIEDLVIADFGLATQYQDPKTILFKRCGTPGFVAPEILNYKEDMPFYNSKCDVFSAGVILYILLTGKQPFVGKDYKEILRLNKTCIINFKSAELKFASEEAKDMLEGMLEGNPDKRPDIKMCLKHAFFVMKEPLDKSISKQLSTTENLKKYDVEFLSVVRNKVADSQEQIGSLALKSTGKLPINGQIDTMGSLSQCSNANINAGDPSKFNAPAQSSQFRYKSQSIDMKEQQQQQKEPEKAKKIKNKQSDLHKRAIKNSVQKGYLEEQKGSDSDGSPKTSETPQQEKKDTFKSAVQRSITQDDDNQVEECCDISEENSPLSDTIQRFNFDIQLKSMGNRSTSKSVDVKDQQHNNIENLKVSGGAQGGVPSKFSQKK